MVLFIESKPQDIVETEMQSLSLNPHNHKTPVFMLVANKFA